MFAQPDGMRWNIGHYQDYQGSTRLYNDALARGLWCQLWARVTGRSQALLSLDEFIQSSTVTAGRSAGTRQVAITQIIGSENRAGDFDRNFNPLQDRTRDRWLSVARAWQQGRYLPPVHLIQVGEYYFVRDGHHRISVAKALGLDTIEACIEVWILEKPQIKSSQVGMSYNRGPYCGYV